MTKEKRRRLLELTSKQLAQIVGQLNLSIQTGRISAKRLKDFAITARMMADIFEELIE